MTLDLRSLNKTVTVFLFLILMWYVLSLKSIYAQQVSLSISPPLLDTTIKPGKSILVAYTLENIGDPAIFKTKILSFEPKGVSGNMHILPDFQGPVRFELDNSNIKMETPFFLKSHDSQQLLLQIRIPEGAPEGDYYYVLLAETQPPPTQEGSAASRASATIGSPILITVTSSGKIDVNSKIALFDIGSRIRLPFFGKMYHFVESSDRVPVYLIVQNNGKNKLQPNGSITLTGNFGEKANYDLLPQNILAQSQRLLTATPSAEFIDTEKPNTLTLSGFFIGKYGISTDVNFGEGTPNISAQTSFIAVPMKFLLGMLVAICVSFLIIQRFKKSDEG